MVSDEDYILKGASQGSFRYLFILKVFHILHQIPARTTHFCNFHPELQQQYD